MEPVSDTVRIPQAAFAAFQLMFAMITAALIAGSVAERMRFSAFVAFTLLWTTLIYDPWRTGSGAVAGWASWVLWILPEVP